MNKEANYLINYDEIKDLKIADIKSKFDKINGLPLSECTISKLDIQDGFGSNLVPAVFGKIVSGITSSEIKWT